MILLARVIGARYSVVAQAVRGAGAAVFAIGVTHMVAAIRRDDTIDATVTRRSYAIRRAGAAIFTIGIAYAVTAGRLANAQVADLRAW